MCLSIVYYISKSHSIPFTYALTLLLPGGCFFFPFNIDVLRPPQPSPARSPPDPPSTTDLWSKTRRRHLPTLIRRRQPHKRKPFRIQFQVNLSVFRKKKNGSWKEEMEIVVKHLSFISPLKRNWFF